MSILSVLQTADKNFKRLTLTQPMGLKYLGLVISVKEVKKVIICYTFYYVILRLICYLLIFVELQYLIIDTVQTLRYHNLKISV